MRSCTPLFLLLATLMLSACGTDSDPNNGATNNGAGSNNGGACAAGEYDETELFDQHEMFPFEMEHPAGWVVVDTSSEDAVSGNVSTADHAFSYQYVVYRDPENATLSEDGWRMSHEVVEEVTYDGELVEVFSLAEGVQAKMLIPHQGTKYQVAITFAGPDECMEERKALRQLFLDGIVPNADTTFPN